MGAPRVTDRRWMVLICAWHHRLSGWETSHKQEIREWLKVNG